VDTVARFERGEPFEKRTVEAIQRALEAAGVEFTNGDQPGVRLKVGSANAIPARRSRRGVRRCAVTPGETVPRLALAGTGTSSNERAADVQVNRLRRKIEHAAEILDAQIGNLHEATPQNGALRRLRLWRRIALRDRWGAMSALGQ
jgi:hypothetical protein